jgi:ubiquinone/menaquinone biosynthesis C-methylase UbiE
LVIPNLGFSVGNFQELPFASDKFGVVFDVESICHATDMEKALRETRRVLRRSGRFVAIDGFRKPEFNGLDAETRRAAMITERAMAVGRGWIVDEWLELAEIAGFRRVSVDDLSYAVEPNLEKLQRLARRYFSHPLLGRAILLALPRHLVMNAIAGLLMPQTFAAGAHAYYSVVLEAV